ncbi:FKBP-type peptidyl-prolyl cis-trans isomerase [Pseudoxanthomonas wuyuanensis]
MEIADHRVATIHYTLTDDAGQVVDRSAPDAPLSYLHGAGNIVPGLEQALTGRKAGDAFSADIPPETGYGPRHDGLVQTLPISAFQSAGTVQPGMRFEARTEHGPLLFTVTQVEEEKVTVDGNHPLAGQTLHFAVEVADVRESTAQEQQQGHAGDGT